MQTILFVSQMNQKRQSKMVCMYMFVASAIFSRNKRIRTFLLFENTSHTHRLSSLEKVVKFLSQSNKRSEHRRTITKLIYTNAFTLTCKKREIKTHFNAAKCVRAFDPSRCSHVINTNFGLFSSERYCNIKKCSPAPVRSTWFLKGQNLYFRKNWLERPAFWVHLRKS